MNIDIEAELAKIQEEIAAEDAAKLAVEQAESDRNEKLVAAKARCLEECGPVSVKLAETTDERERTGLIQLEARVHASHADDLEAAYLEHAGQRVGDSHPATPGIVTPLSSHGSVASESSGTAEPI